MAGSSSISRFSPLRALTLNVPMGQSIRLRRAPSLGRGVPSGSTRRHHYYGPLRHPTRPGRAPTEGWSLAESRLPVTRRHRRGFPCCLSFPLSCMPSRAPTAGWSPRWDRRASVARSSPRQGKEAHHPATTAFPVGTARRVVQAGRLPQYPFRGRAPTAGWSDVHSRSACRLADFPRKPFLEVLQSISLPPRTAPSATGWSNKLPGGIRTH